MKYSSDFVELAQAIEEMRAARTRFFEAQERFRLRELQIIQASLTTVGAAGLRATIEQRRRVYDEMVDRWIAEGLPGMQPELDKEMAELQRRVGVMRVPNETSPFSDKLEIRSPLDYLMTGALGVETAAVAPCLGAAEHRVAAAPQPFGGLSHNTIKPSPPRPGTSRPMLLTRWLALFARLWPRPDKSQAVRKNR